MAWRFRRREWTVREHPTRRNTLQWFHEESGYTVEYRGHRSSWRWCIVFDGQGRIVQDPHNHSRFWDYGDLEEVAHLVTEKFIPENKLVIPEAPQTQTINIEATPRALEVADDLLNSLRNHLQANHDNAFWDDDE